MFSTSSASDIVSSSSASTAGSMATGLTDGVFSAFFWYLPLLRGRYALLRVLETGDYRGEGGEVGVWLSE